MKPWRLALVLAVVVFALGALATWDEWQTKKDDEAKKTENRLTLMKPEDVTELAYATKGNTEITAAEKGGVETKSKVEAYELTAVKNDGKWQLTKPVAALGDQEGISGLLKTLTDYSYTKDLGIGKEKWAEYGLQDPLRTVTMKATGAKPEALTIYVGNKAPVGYSVYFRTDKSDHVYMGSQHLLTSTSRSLFEFRDKTVVKIDEAGIKTLSYKRKNQESIGLSKADGKWAIATPSRLEADAAEVRDFIEEVNALRASNFIDKPDPALQAAFAAPDLELTWQGETGAPTTLRFTEKDDTFYASFDPAQRAFVLAKDQKAKLAKDLTHFRNRRILDQKLMADIQQVQIDGDTYKNFGGEWYKPGEEKDKTKEQGHLRAFVVDLEFAKTDDFLAPTDAQVKKAEGAAPQHRITLTPKAGSPMTLDLYAADAADQYLVKVSGAPYVYRVAKSAFNSMTPAKATAAPAESSGDGDASRDEGSADDGFGDDKLHLDEEGDAPTG